MRILYLLLWWFTFWAQTLDFLEGKCSFSRAVTQQGHDAAAQVTWFSLTSSLPVRVLMGNATHKQRGANPSTPHSLSEVFIFFVFESQVLLDFLSLHPIWVLVRFMTVSHIGDAERIWEIVSSMSEITNFKDSGGNISFSVSHSRVQFSYLE